MFRAIGRLFSTDETKRLAKDVDDMADKLLDYGHAVEGLQRRIERHLNKLRMQDTRAQARGSEPRLTEEEREILDDIRRQGGHELPPGRDPFYS